MELYVRSRFLPTNLSDWLSFAFILVTVPLFYCYELCVVLPDAYPDENLWYYLHFILCTFVMQNVVGNFLAIICIDTSLDTVDAKMIDTLSRNSDRAIPWKYCSVCQRVAPPRSWHCDICRKCILKRDHHCTFSGCCIGFRNNRYFLMFLFYMFLACCYALCFNFPFVLKHVKDATNPYTWIKTMMPVAILLLGLDTSAKHCYFIMLVLNVVGLFMTGYLLKHHAILAIKGAVTYEMDKNIREYDLGSLKLNLMAVMGFRWYLACISPFIPSPPIQDGVDWNKIYWSHSHQTKDHSY